MNTFLLFFFIIFILIAFGYGYYQLDKTYRSNYKVAIPFKESLDLTGLPVVTFENEGTKLHLLIDTGTDYSIMDKEASKMCHILGTKDPHMDLITGGGVVEAPVMAKINISYKDLDFEADFLVCDLSKQFTDAFEGKIIVHGVLGSNFFRKYKYKIDYSDLAVYARK